MSEYFRSTFRNYRCLNFLIHVSKLSTSHQKHQVVCHEYIAWCTTRYFTWYFTWFATQYITWFSTWERRFKNKYFQNGLHSLNTAKNGNISNKLIGRSEAVSALLFGYENLVVRFPRRVKYLSFLWISKIYKNLPQSVACQSWHTPIMPRMPKFKKVRPPNTSEIEF